MSESFPSPFKHGVCSKLSAMNPKLFLDILYKIQNNLTATICFPTGIKISHNKENGPNIIKDYITSITNQKDERYYYTMTYHLYLKYNIEDYHKRYEEYPFLIKKIV